MSSSTPAVYAYLFKDNALVVDEQLQIPLFSPHQQDLLVRELPEKRIVTRDLNEQDILPEGLQLVPIRQLVSNWSMAEFELASRALQLLEWQRNHQFCSRCGNVTVKHERDHAMVCTVCQYSQYPRVQPCVIMAITRGNEILLARNVQRPGKMFGLLAGFVEVGETLEQAVARETLEEVGVEISNIRYMASQPWPFPSNLMIAFQAEYVSGEITPQVDEIAEAAFFPFDQLPMIPPKGSIAYHMIDQIVHHQHTIAGDGSTQKTMQTWHL